MVDNYINEKDHFFYKKRFYNVLASIPIVVITLIVIYLSGLGLTFFCNLNWSFSNNFINSVHLLLFKLEKVSSEDLKGLFEISRYMDY